MGGAIVKDYKDHGISGAKARDERPALDPFSRDGIKPVLPCDGVVG
jgi:hypothetical protein